MKNYEVRKIQDARIPCPYCGSVLSITSDIVELLYFECPGCSRIAFVYGVLLISLKPNEMGVIETAFGSEIIGQVTHCDLKSRYLDRDPITEKQLEELKKILDSEDPFNGILSI